MGNDNIVPVEINVDADRAARKFADIQLKKQKIKELRKMLKDGFDGDADYHIKSTEVKEKKRELKAITDRIANQPALFKLRQKIEELTNDLKDDQLALFADLEAYTRTTNMSTIEIGGKVKTIVKEFKLKSE